MIPGGCNEEGKPQPNPQRPHQSCRTPPSSNVYSSPPGLPQPSGVTRPAGSPPFSCGPLSLRDHFSFLIFARLRQFPQECERQSKILGLHTRTPLEESRQQVWWRGAVYRMARHESWKFLRGVPHAHERMVPPGLQT